MDHSGALNRLGLSVVDVGLFWVTYLVDNISTDECCAFFVSMKNVIHVVRFISIDFIRMAFFFFIFRPSDNTTEAHYLCSIENISSNTSLDNDSTCGEESVGLRGILWWAVIGQLIYGLGQAPFVPVVVPYLDDLAGRVRRRYVVYYSKCRFFADLKLWHGSFSIQIPPCGVS